MFTSLFSTSPAVWAGLIGAAIALPLLIHLINLMRHTRVKWAAMDFLMKSYKKNRNWVWLKQLFLLLSRIAALLLALFMLGNVGCENDRISELLGGETTHHYVLLDDSFSMSDQGSEGAAFDRARSALSMIASRAQNRPNQLFTLIRFSKSRPVAETKMETNSAEGIVEDSVSQQADINGELVDTIFEQRLEEVKAGLSVSMLSVGLQNSAQLVRQLISQRENENAIVYVLSDFRSSDWENGAEVDRQLAGIRNANSAVELISCARTEHTNLAVTAIQPAGNVRVAGTPLMMQVTVKNCSGQTAEKIQLQVVSKDIVDVSDQWANPETIEMTVNDLPTIFVESLDPGQSETRQFPVFFNSPGQHIIQAVLPDDAIAADNTRQVVVEFSNSASVLMIDDAEQIHASFLANAINPNGMTRIQPEFRTKDFLRDADPNQLAGYDVIFMLDVDRIDESSVRNLESYVESGGGVAFFLGPKTNLDFYTSQLYRSGEGVFPIPLDRAMDVPELDQQKLRDIVPLPHPVFGPTVDSKNSLMNLVQIKRFIQPPIEWTSAETSRGTADVLATVRGKKEWPLVVESRFGRGRTLVFTTTLGPIWNNWARNPTLPLTLLLAEDYLATGRYEYLQHLVGDSLGIDVDLERYGRDVQVVTPLPEAPDDETVRLVSERALESMNQVDRASEARKPEEANLQIGMSTNGQRETDLPGIYEAWLRPLDANRRLPDVRRYALNVDSTESEMDLMPAQEVLNRLPSAGATFTFWDQFNPNPKQKPASTFTRLLLFVLLGVLLLEMVLAYSSSYHPARKRPSQGLGSSGRTQRGASGIRGAA